MSWPRSFNAQVLAGVAAFLLLCLVGTLLFDQTRQVASPGTTHSHGRGGLSALRRVYSRLGIESTSLKQPIATLERDGVVVRAFVDREQFTSPGPWKRWVERGNTLILLTHDGSPDWIAYRSLRLELPEAPGTSEISEDDPIGPRRLETLGEPHLRVHELSVHGDGWDELDDAESALLADAGGSFVTRLALGEGQVLQVYDGAMFSNERLGDADHALLAVDLLDGATHVMFDERMHGYRQGIGMLDFLFLRGSGPLWSCGLLVTAIWIWWGRAPIRPIYPWHARRRDDRSEYVQSLARLIERRRRPRELVARMRRHVVDLLSDRMLGRHAASPHEVLELAHRRGLIDDGELTALRSEPDDPPAALAVVHGILVRLRG